MTVLLLLLKSARVSGQLVQETARARLSSYPGRSSQWGYRKKAFLPHSNPECSWTGAEGLGEMGNNPSVFKDLRLALVRVKVFWLLKAKLVTLAWH